MDRIIKISYRPLLLILAVCFVLGTTTSIAQEQLIKLEEVEITSSPIEKFGVGGVVTTLDSTLIQGVDQASLGALLSMQSAVYIKQYGAGMLSSISFRGTGASHTSVRWNGMQVGYPFLGQTDLSLIPLDFVDKISLVHGSSSARFGTGAIGGIIDLESSKPKNGLELMLNQSLGSFGATNTTLQLSTAGSKGYLQVGGYYKKSTNDFPYKSGNGSSLGKQQNASFSLSGLQFSSQYRFNKTNALTLSVQAASADRNLQPSIGSSASANQKDANVWSSLKYQHYFTKGVINAQYGYLFDEINYEGSITSSYQHKGSAVLEYDVLLNLSVEAGINTTLVRVETPFYSDGVGQENRTNIFTSLLWQPINKLALSLNLRQAFVTDYVIPFTPSLGIQYHLVASADWKLNLKGQLAKGYKVPTLNDRFWVPGGNLNLLPEESVNAELGFDLTRKGKMPYWIKGTAYQLWVDNWILWLPNGAIWSPENKRNVKGFGVEIETGLEKQLGNTLLKGWLNYAYTKSTNQEALDEYDRSAGKQLPYVPFHNGNITGQVVVGMWDIQLNGIATGKRFITTDNETEVPGYILLNLQTGYRFRLEHWQARAYVTINNITNTNYQSIINRAMPGVNFLAGIKINFNK